MCSSETSPYSSTVKELEISREEGGFQDQNNKKKGAKVNRILSMAGGVDFMELNN